MNNNIYEKLLKRFEYVEILKDFDKTKYKNAFLLDNAWFLYILDEEEYIFIQKTTEDQQSMIDMFPFLKINKFECNSKTIDNILDQVIVPFNVANKIKKIPLILDCLKLFKKLEKNKLLSQNEKKLIQNIEEYFEKFSSFYLGLCKYDQFINEKKKGK